MGDYGMNYAQATDKELNGRLLELIHGDVVNYRCLSDDETFIYDCGPIGEDFHKIELKDYCNDWNATMPLSVEHEISVIRLNDGYVAFTGWVWIDMSHHDCMDDIAIDGDEFIFHANTYHLRAIVICLIKVLEVKNGN